MCSIFDQGSSTCQVVHGCQLEVFHGGSGKICLPMQEMRVRSLGQEDPLEKKMGSHSSVAAWEIPCQRSLVGSGSWGHKRVEHDLATKQHVNQKAISKIFRQLKPSAGINLS